MDGKSVRVGDMERDLAPVQRWYLDELHHLGEYGKAARYKVELMSIQAARKAIIASYLDGDVKNLYKAETPKSVKDEWNELGSKQTALLNEAVVAHMNQGSPRLKHDEEKEEELPDFITEDGYMTRKAMKLMSSGWYQNSSGELYHYDGVVWDNVPSGKIDDLEFLGG